MIHRQFACVILGLVFLAALVWAGEAESCPIVQRAYVTQSYVSPTYSVPVVQIIPVAVPVPQYSVGYDYQGQAMLQQLQALQAEVARLRMSGIPQSQGTALPATLPPPLRSEAPTEKSNLTRSQRGNNVLMQTCSKCHDKSVAATKAKNHIFFDAGKLLEPDKNVGPMLEQIDTGKMPPDSKLTDRNIADLFWRLTVQETTTEEKK